MRNGLLVVIAAATGFALVAGHDRLHAQAPPAAPPQKDYRPGLGDLMLLVVQPRHAKLGLAGSAGNWPLAAYSLNELKQALTKAGQHAPRWRNGFPIPETTNALLADPVEALETAIKAADAAAFATAYARVTAGCNACHAAANIGFITIKTPDASAFPSQDFQPRTK